MAKRAEEAEGQGGITEDRREEIFFFLLLKTSRFRTEISTVGLQLMIVIHLMIIVSINCIKYQKMMSIHVSQSLK